MLRSRFAVVAAVLAIAACSPDTTTPSTARPAGEPASRSTTAADATPLNMTIFPNEIVADGTHLTTARVNVDSVVSCCDRIVHVSSSDPATLPLAPTATVAAGTSFAGIDMFPSVSQRTVVTISATGNGVTVSADVILDPPGTTIPPTLSSFTVNPTTVNAGTTATGTVTIPNAAPAGGIAINLGSLLPGSAQVPSSVTVPQGATHVSFPITTFAGFPNSTSCVRMFATTSVNEVEGDICVVTGGTNPSPPPLAAPTLLSPSSDSKFAPGTNISFDWTDITGAASYELQIDDTDKFEAPLILDQTVTASQLSTATLPTSTMFWRVRAISSSGASGAWSSVRRFEIKQ